LARSLNYPFTANEVVQNLHHLRHTRLISLYWHKRLIKREKTMKEYVTTYVVTSEMWSIIIEDWRRISRAIEAEYGKANPEYRELLEPKRESPHSP
jgi:hypothetical protein